MAQLLKGVKRECQSWGESQHQENPTPKNSSSSGLPVPNDGSATLPVAFDLSPVPPNLQTLRPFSHLKVLWLVLSVLPLLDLHLRVPALLQQLIPCCPSSAFYILYSVASNTF